MNLILKDFQADAVEKFVSHLRRAGGDAQRHDEQQAVSLSAPTGSGKTVMATAAIERLIQGDEDNAPNPEATFLWITDQPELNEQTRQKMLWGSSGLKSQNLVVVDASFDQEALTPGTVYFLNTQKLGKGTALTSSGGDKRNFSFWESVANTVARRPGSFYLFLDEAHRGMMESKDRTKANSIVQKFVKGSEEDGLPAVPLIAGISATPERFTSVISGTDRVHRPVDVDVEDVRASGLLKEAITLYHPSETQPSDLTMLRASAKSWADFTSRWGSYCEDEGEPPVHPILVVQIEDGTGTGKNALSKTDIAGLLSAIEGEIGPLPDEAFAHALQSGATEDVGGRGIRYLAPSAIQGDPDVKVVLFKSSLNTGWDCPRAEVMMSFRKAVDATLIAQLVGRMVRTPLTRRVDADEHLNTVSLYLPHYDEDRLNSVIEKLTSPEDGAAAVEIRRGENVVSLQRAEGSEDAFAVLSEIPSYIVPRVRKTSEISRLMKLARQLERDELIPDASEAATALLLKTLRSEYERVKGSGGFADLMDDLGLLDVKQVRYTYGEASPVSSTDAQIAVSTENVDDLFATAGRKLKEGVHKAWWRSRVTEDGVTSPQAKLEISALVAMPPVMAAVDEAAGTQITTWMEQIHVQYKALSEGEQQAYRAIQGLSPRPVETTLTFPDSIEGKMDEDTWEKHLYVDENGTYRAKLGSWERKVITEEIARDDVRWWLRVVDRKDWALTVPYPKSGTENKPLYPDFLVVRETDGGLVVDILDPHNIELPDSVDKAQGLATFAKLHRNDFGRIEMIIEEDGTLKRIDLRDENKQRLVAGVNSREALRLLFD